MVGNSLHLAGKILVLVKLMALTIYDKAGLLRPRPIIKASRPRPRPRTCSRKATNFGLKAKAKD